MMLDMRLTRYAVPLAAAAILLAAPAVAQDPEPTDPRCVCFGAGGEGAPWAGFASAHRARMGVVLGQPAEVAGRSGIRLESVPEGSPAREGGLRSGDVVVALDGVALGGDPTSDLLARMRDVEPGDTVVVTFIRGGDEHTARVITESAGARLAAFADGRRLHVAPRIEAATARLLHRQRARDGLELATVQAELGEYFGTDHGVLVTAVSADSRLGLRAGDVILAIGGRVVRDPGHVRSILSSYRDDEDIPLRIVRAGRTLEVIGQRS